MRLSQTPPTLLSLLLVVLSHTNNVNAGPYPKDDLHDLGYSFLQPRQCACYCGSQNQFCCTAGQGCYTTYSINQNIAFCSASAAATAGDNARYAVYTTTYTETDLILRTSTYTSSWVAAPTTTYAYVPPAASPSAADVPASCTTSLGQSSCGKICCASGQRCAGANTCTPDGSSYYYPTQTAVASSYSAPLRPTSGGVSTSTGTVSVTTTQTFLPPATASGSAFPTITASSNNGLSPGAIAGIVIGVIAGIILLLLICFCCIVKAGFDGLLAIFGLGKRRRRSTERVETVERYSRHGSGTASRRDTHTGWFGGGRPVRVTETRRKKRTGGFGGLGAVGAGLAGLALVLGLKRRHDRNEKPPRSDISSSYYTDSYTGTSASK